MAAFTVIDHTELGAAASSWDVTSIPTDGTYDHLLVKVSARTDKATGPGWADALTFLNADTGNNYSTTLLYAQGATPYSLRQSSHGDIEFLYCPSAVATAATFGSTTVWIPHYANTDNYKQIINRSAQEAASTTANDWYLTVSASLWQDTSAIDQITLTADASADFVQYSTFTLYGVTGA